MNTTRPSRLLVPVLGVLAACAELPTAPPEQPAFSALPAAQCQTVRGNSAGNVFGFAVATGDLQGIVIAYQAPIVKPAGQAIHLETFHRFLLADGSIDTVDRGIQAPIDPPLYRLNNDYRVVGGTGAWAGATGFLSIHGTLVIDFTFQDPRNGDIAVSYHGRICRG